MFSDVFLHRLRKPVAPLVKLGRVQRRRIALLLRFSKAKLKQKTGPYYRLFSHVVFPATAVILLLNIHWLLIYLPEFLFLTGKHLYSIPCRVPFFYKPPNSWKEELSYKPFEHSQVESEAISHDIRELYPMGYTIEPERKCAGRLVEGGLAVFAISAANNFEERFMTRETWGSIALEKRLSSKVYLVFLVGLPNPAKGDVNSTQRALVQENEDYGDILQVGLKDIKFNIALKEYAGIAWIEGNCPEGTHIFKTDDDVYVTIDKLLDLVKSNKPEESAIHGWIEEGGCFPTRSTNKVLRKESNLDKNFKQDLNYPFIHNPSFAVQSYLITAAAVPEIVAAADEGPFWAVQGDFYITGILAERAKIQKIHNRNMRMSFQESFLTRFLLPKWFMKWRYQDTMVFSHIHAEHYHLKETELVYIHSLFKS